MSRKWERETFLTLLISLLYNSFLSSTVCTLNLLARRVDKTTITIKSYPALQRLLAVVPGVALTEGRGRAVLV